MRKGGNFKMRRPGNFGMRTGGRMVMRIGGRIDANMHGGVLLPSGAELTESTLTSLRRRGIEQVTVVNDQISEADLAIERARVQERLAKLFRICADKSASNSLHESIMQYRMGERS